MSGISRDEVLLLLRKALTGEVSVKLVDPRRSWGEVFAGDVEFFFGDWQVTVFNDCDSFDYIDSIVAPDGRKGDFEDWRSDDGSFQCCPSNYLTADEFANFERLLEVAV